MNKKDINLTEEQIIEIGYKELFTQCAKIKKLELYCSDGDGNLKSEFFGIYALFTWKTQHIYGTIEELAYILGILGLNLEDKPLIYCEDNFNKAEKDTVKHMKYVADLYGIKIKENDYDEIYEKYFCNCKHFLGGNYFYNFLIGKEIYYRNLI